MTTLIEQIRTLEEILLRPHPASAKAEISALIHEDFEEIESTGKSVSRPDVLAWMMRANDDIFWTLSDFRLKQVSEGVVVACYHAHKNTRLTDGNIDSLKHSLRSSTWKKSGEGWAIIFHHCSKISH